MPQTGFTPSQVALVLDRDGHRCPICGERAQTANHRANRGHGGHRASNRLANACAICHRCNDAIERDGDLAALARDRGVKISRYDDPTKAEYLHPIYGMRVRLDDTGGFAFV